MKPMIGLQTLLTLPVLAPLALQINPIDPGPTVIDTRTLFSYGVVMVLITVVFKAGKEVQKLNGKLDVLDRLSRRMTRLENHVGIPSSED